MSDKLDELNALIEKARGMIPGGSRAGVKRLRGGYTALVARSDAGQSRLGDGRRVDRINTAGAYLASRKRGRKRALNAGGVKVKGPKRSGVYKAKPKTLYVYRALESESAAEIIAWAQAQGFKSIVEADNMHVTVCWSKTPLNWARLGDDWTCEPVKRTAGDDYRDEMCNAVSYRDGGNKIKRISGGPREVKALGDKGAVVLAFQSVSLTERWAQFIRLGASNKFPGYTPHITLTFDGKGVDLAKVEPFTGDILLGEEEWAECDDNWQAKVKETVVTKTVLNDLASRLDAVEKAQAKPASEAA